MPTRFPVANTTPDIKPEKFGDKSIGFINDPEFIPHSNVNAAVNISIEKFKFSVYPSTIKHAAGPIMPIEFPIFLPIPMEQYFRLINKLIPKPNAGDTKHNIIYGTVDKSALYICTQTELLHLL